MAELSFTKEGSKYVCEFEVSSDFNLHLERDKGGFLFLYQRSSDGGSYDSVGDAKFAPHDSIIDYDCTALVYPKTIKIVSEVEPTYAAVTTDGEVTEIKSQSKEVEVTANGAIDIVPDAGFSYLNSVKVKTNVPKGEGGSGGGGGSNVIEYLYLSKGTGTLMNLNKSIPIEWKGKNMMTNKVMSISLQSADSYGSMTPLTVLKVIKGIVVIDGVEYDNTSYEKLLQSNGINSSHFTEITEEEYNNYTV